MALPVSRAKRDVFVLDSPAALPGCPLVIDPAGVWFRPEGRVLPVPACRRATATRTTRRWTPSTTRLFDDAIWPVLAARMPAFEALRVRSAWAGYYEMNAFDHNGLAGPLPGWRNAYTACGFSGHGMQQAPAVGSALAAAIAGGTATRPRIEALAPRRMLEGRPLVERNVI